MFSIGTAVKVVRNYVPHGVDLTGRTGVVVGSNRTSYPDYPYPIVVSIHGEHNITRPAGEKSLYSFLPGELEPILPELEREIAHHA